MAELPFQPCSQNCPAVTGQPFGSVQFCPMAEFDRHRNCSNHGPDSRPVRESKSKDQKGQPKRKLDANGEPMWEGFDWRIGAYVPLTATVRVDEASGVEYHHFEPQIPLHPDYTDCCANFQCCADKWAAAGLGAVKDSLVGAAETGGSVALVRADDGSIHPLSPGPDMEIDERDPKIDPREGDSATKRGITWAIVSVRRGRADDGVLQLTNPNARRGTLRSVSLAEWQADFQNHRRSGGR